MNIDIERVSPRIRKSALIAVIILLCLEIAGVFVYIVGNRPEPKAVKGQKKQTAASLKSLNNNLKAKLNALKPSGLHIVIDTAENILVLKEGSRVIRKAVVSCGSGNVLNDPSGKRSWVFDTPRGEYNVLKKVVNPNWIKPDWAFIEEGTAIPKSFKDRVEEGVMGDFALGFGNGYYIHGTLYSRLLGRNVSHGCVRVGDDDLKAVFNTAPIGTRIYIF